MYNVEQKQLFLNTLANDNTFRSYVRVFNNVQNIEEMFGKDVCDMDVDEILTLLDLKSGTRHTGSLQTASMLRNYTDFCIQNGKTTSENNFDKINATSVDKTRIYQTKYLGSTAEFEEMVSTVFDTSYDYNETIDIPKELAVRLCFLGMTDLEIVRIKKTDVDYERGVIKSSLFDREYKISERMKKLCLFSAEQEFVELNGNNFTRNERLCNNDYLLRQRIATLRECPEDRAMNKAIIVKRVKDFADMYYELTDNYKNITAAKLRESGIFCSVFESGGSPELVHEMAEKEILQKGKVSGTRSYKEGVKRLEETYYMWQSVFH